MHYFSALGRPEALRLHLKQDHTLKEQQRSMKEVSVIFFRPTPDGSPVHRRKDG